MRRDLDRWHKALAPLAGEICRALVLRKVRRSDMDRWAEVLEAAAEEMRDAAGSGDRLREAGEE